MDLWLVIAAVMPAHSPGVPALAPPPEARPHVPNVNLRLIDQPAYEPGRVRRSGMIVETLVSRNAAVGVGLFRLSTRKPSMTEPRIEGRKPTAKKAGFSFRLQF